MGHIALGRGWPSHMSSEDPNGPLFLVTVRRTVTSVVDTSKLEGLSGDFSEEWAIEHPGELFDLAADNAPYVDEEFMASAPAEFVCRSCFAPLVLEAGSADVSIVLEDNATRPVLSYGALSTPSLGCSKRCGAELTEEEERRLLEMLRGGTPT